MSFFVQPHISMQFLVQLHRQKRVDKPHISPLYRHILSFLIDRPNLSLIIGNGITPIQ